MKPLFQSAVSGQWYENPGVSGYFSAVRVDGRHLFQKRSSLEKPQKPVCTQCKGAAGLGYSHWVDAKGKVVVKNRERLCQPCFLKRIKVKP